MATKDDGDNVDAIANLLRKTEVRQQNIVTFKGQALKLDKAEDAADIVDAIRDSPDLQVLELVGNTVGVEAAKAIARALRDRSELERCLWADMFTGRLRAEIPPSLRALGEAIVEANAHLVEIDLSDNAFGPDGVKACVDLLKSEAAYTLEVLKFNNNGLGIGGKILAETLIECHRRSSEHGKPLSLKVFIAGRNRLENPGATALAQAFKTIGTLEEIQMPQNGINHQGISALAEAVKNSPNLRHLNLNDNTFTSKGAVAMAGAIREIDSLEIINFGDCLVRTEGASAIGEALQNSNPQLRELILSFGEVQLEGAIRVCEGLAGSEVLERVDLNGNQLGDDGIEEVVDMAKDFGFSDALCSFSDDDGVDSDEENESDSDEEEDEESGEEERETQQERYETPQLANGMNGFHATSDQDSVANVTAEDFPDNISAKDLLALGEARRKELLQAAITRIGPEPEAYVDSCVKIAGLLENDNANGQNQLKKAVFQCTNEYLSKAFQNCRERPMQAVDRLLIRLGLLKSEEKSVKPVQSVRPLLLVLENALAQPYYPQNTKKIVRAMVAKSNRVWESNLDLQSQILRQLY